jgi:hypothetical protein
MQTHDPLSSLADQHKDQLKDQCARVLVPCLDLAFEDRVAAVFIGCASQTEAVIIAVMPAPGLRSRPYDLYPGLKLSCAS